MNISPAELKSFTELMIVLAELKGDLEALRAENKALREDRDSWKEMAMRTSGKTEDGK